MKRIEFIYLLTGFCTICSCTSKANSEIKEVITEVHNTVTEAITEIVEKDIMVLWKKHLEKVSKLNWLLLNNIRKCLIFTNSLFRSILKSFR